MVWEDTVVTGIGFGEGLRHAAFQMVENRESDTSMATILLSQVFIEIEADILLDGARGE